MKKKNNNNNNNKNTQNQVNSDSLPQWRGGHVARAPLGDALACSVIQCGNLIVILGYINIIDLI